MVTTGPSPQLPLVSSSCNIKIIHSQVFSFNGSKVTFACTVTAAGFVSLGISSGRVDWTH